MKQFRLSTGALRVAAPLITVLAVLSCALERSQPSAAVKQEPVQSTEEPVGARDVDKVAYERARWRLLTFDQLDETTLWLSHIAIRHVESSAAAFRPANWTPDGPNPERSVEDAFALAGQVEKELVAHPERFGALAERYSEDVVSAWRGGQLGGVRASQLPAEFLDALAVLHEGESSRVFRTAYGFHLLRREPPPAAALVSGRRIAIGYPGTMGHPLRFVPSRTKAEALHVARELRKRALAGEEFAKLASEFSENADRDAGGDIGSRSLRDPEYLPVEVQILSGMRDGDISEPFDSRFGYEVLLRTPVEPRKEYGMAFVRLRFDATHDSGEYSQRAVLDAARRISRDLQAKPKRFAEFQSQHCCKVEMRWTQGSGSARIERALERLRFGEIASEPVLDDWFYLIPMRLDPLSVSQSRSYELPSPRWPDVEKFLEFNDGQTVAVAARDLATHLEESPQHDRRVVALMTDDLRALAEQIEGEPAKSPALVSAIAGTVSELRKLLGDEPFEEFSGYAKDWLASNMLR